MGIEAEPESDAGVARGDRGMTTSVTLLEQTKSYLQAQLHRVAPDSILTQAWEEFYRVYSNLVRRFVLAQGLAARMRTTASRRYGSPWRSS